MNQFIQHQGILHSIAVEVVIEKHPDFMICPEPFNDLFCIPV
jgi:hypothetical protein